MALQEKLKESFDGCRLCLGLYKTPKILQCLHSFCLACLEGQLQNSEHGNIVTCPLCQQSTLLRYRGVHGLTTNSFIVRKQYLKGLHLQMQSNYSSGTDSDDPVDTGSGSEADISSESLHADMNLSPENTDANLNQNISTDRDDASHYRVNPASPASRGLTNYFDFSCSVHKKESFGTRNLRSELEDNAMNLRSEVLGVTEAIDVINQYVRSWRQRKSDLRSKIQHRSYLLQKQVQDEETMLFEQIENLPSENEFLQEAEIKKRDLHSSLKSSLQAVAFSRQILSEGTEEDINALGDIVNQRLKQNAHEKVFLNIPQFQLDVPNKKMANMISEAFGEIIQNTTEKNIYSPHNFYEVNTNCTIDPDDEIQVFETETILVKASDFSKVKPDPLEVKKNMVNAEERSPGGIRVSGNGYIARRPDSINLQSVTDEDLSKLSHQNEDKMTFNRFMNLRTSLRDRRNKILRDHSGSSAPSPQRDVYNQSATTTTSTLVWDAKQALMKPKPRQRVRRHHTLNTYFLPNYDSGISSGQSYDSLTSPTIPEKPEEPTDGSYDNQNGHSEHPNDGKKNVIRISNVRENIRRRKGSWRSLTLS